MYKFIVFKNSKGACKLNVELKKGVDSLADLSNAVANIIHYVCDKNNYNFNIATNVDDNHAATIDESVFDKAFLLDMFE